jgi:mannose/cellobiose epimerase-like protein (N-acyl-D-glucosamine 2-epimerase family)
LHTHGRLTRNAVDPETDRLLAIAASHADASTGLLPDEVTPGETAGALTYRCWPQCESARAWLAAHERENPGAAAEAGRALGNLRTRYVSGAVRGGWIDQFDQSGAPLATHIPASTFYHLFGAIVEADRVLGV